MLLLQASQKCAIVFVPGVPGNRTAYVHCNCMHTRLQFTGTVCCAHVSLQYFYRFTNFNFIIGLGTWGPKERTAPASDFTMRLSEKK